MNTDKQSKLELFMDEIVIAICLRNGDAYNKSEIIKKAADKYYATQKADLLKQLERKAIPNPTTPAGEPEMIPLSASEELKG